MVYVAQLSYLTENRDQWLDGWNWDILLLLLLLRQSQATERHFIIIRFMHIYVRYENICIFAFTPDGTRLVFTQVT